MLKIKKLLAEAELSRARKQVQKAKKAPLHHTDALFNDSYQKFRIAANFDPRNSDVLHYWGLALLDHARVKGGTQANTFFRLASEQFQAALKIDPNNTKVLNDWGATLMEQARSKSTTAASPFYKRAREKFMAAEAIDSGVAAYNLACLHSLQGARDECRTFLELAREKGRLPTREHLKKDEDLQAFREEEWFTAFLESLEKKRAVANETASSR